MRMPIALALFLSAGNLVAQEPASVHFTIEKLGDGVFAAIASDTGFAVCNAGIVDLGDGVLVFDSFISPRAAADLRRAAVALTRKQVTYVVNSHSHNDHMRGNQEFPGARIVSTVSTRKAIAENEPEEIAWESANAATKLTAAQAALDAEGDVKRRAEAGFWVSYYKAILDSHGSLRTVLPNVTFEGKLIIHGSARTVELIDIGPGHTEGDLILYLPVERIAFMGDLLFINRHPYIPDGFPQKWVRALEQVKALEIYTAVPGHGPVGNASNLDTMAGYIKALEHLGTDLSLRGATDQDIAAQVMPSEYRLWWFSRFFQPNLKFMVNLAKEQAAGK